MIRRAVESDFEGLHRLYRELVGDIPVPDGAAGAAQLAQILTHPGTSIFVADVGGLVSMATLHILPNMTQGGRSYALIENVVTRQEFQGQGHARKVMEAAINAAWDADCYKIMLLTGQSQGARGFYERLGFDPDEKHAMTMRRAPQRRPA